MLKLLLLFGHLLGTSLALGAIVATDLRLVCKLCVGGARLAPPNQYVARLVTAALVVLYLTGGSLVALGVEADPTYLANPKLQGKLVLVLVLTINAVMLHQITFPSLLRGRPLSRWRLRHFARVALPVAVSNTLWMFCAFLGIARPWNHTVSIGFVLGTAAWLVAGFAAATCVMLVIAARLRPGWRPGMNKPFGSRFGALAKAAPALLIGLEETRSAGRSRQPGRRPFARNHRRTTNA